MGLDLNKYRALFLEEATDHLGEISRALLDLEKEPDAVESIDTIFRMAHSIKSMAASLGYDGISQLSHALEDRMQSVRADARVESSCLGLLFRGLEQLEAMVEQVRSTGEAPASADARLLSELSAVPDSAAVADPVDGADGAAPVASSESVDYTESGRFTNSEASPAAAPAATPEPPESTPAPTPAATAAPAATRKPEPPPAKKARS